MNHDLKDKDIAQFCCNNGRELLSLMKLGAKKGIAFDIAENMIRNANETSKKLGANCDFMNVINAICKNMMINKMIEFDKDMSSDLFDALYNKGIPLYHIS